jgi:mono/diheme cytochrome c family protein
VKTLGAYLILTLSITSCVPSGQKTNLVFESKDNGNGPVTVYNREKSINAFKTTLHPFVRAKTCISCHTAQSPAFAQSNAVAAFDAITMSRKVDLCKPETSRIVLKLKDDSHNCWTQDCNADSQALLAEIKKWAAGAGVDCNSTGSLKTETKPFPSSLDMAQTEHGTLLLQAEQSLWESEIIQGRFGEAQDSMAGEGKFLHFLPIESNPRNVTRNLTIDAARFSTCREFDDAQDINNVSNRAIKVMQDRVHNPSETILSESNIVNDGHAPKIASLQYNIIRPDKRLEYAQMLVSRDFTNLNSVLLTDGFPVTVARQKGQKLGGFTGTPILRRPAIFVLPKFASHGIVFDGAGNFKSGKNLHNVFQQSFNETLSSIKENLSKPDFSPLKQYAFYKDLKDYTTDIFYSGSTLRTNSNINYATFLGNDVQAMLSRDAAVTFQCPPSIPNCDASELRFTINQSGPVLTQSTALDCYQIYGTQIVEVPTASCNTGDSKFFHLIDLYVHVTVNSPAVVTRSVNTLFTSTTPNSFSPIETYNSNPSNQIFLNDLVRREENPDYLYVSPSSNVSLSDKIDNFTVSTYNVLRGASCVTCHGASSPGVGVPQFASGSPANSYQAIKQYINFDEPNRSFRFIRTGMLAHNCTLENANNCAGITSDLVNSINAWKAANDQVAQTSGLNAFKNLSRNERLPGRAKYNFKITEQGKYNVWAKLKNIGAGAQSRINFRLIDSNNASIPYSTSSTGDPTRQTCYPWTIGTSADVWEWTSPGRQNELAVLDQRGNLLLNNSLQPLALPDSRIYFNLTPGDYTLDIIGLTEGVKLDVVGLNKVTNPPVVASRLEFQPDRRAIDEKHVSDYKRRILRYDLSSLLRLTDGKTAFFEIEVKKEFNNQNYVFRNPRFITSPSNFNIYVKGIKVLINGVWNFPDATFKNLEAVVGDNKVLTYAPLVSLVGTNSDEISFEFEKLNITQDSLSTLYPKGPPPSIAEDRRCLDLDFFVRNVKPILRNSRVMLNTELNDYFSKFPGGPRDGAREPQAYNCISCHGPNHPYFKMSTFTNDEEFCREAISRVDFDNFYQSLVVRGINGTGNHPKFVFVEKFQREAASPGYFKTHDLGSDYESNLIVGGNGIASKIVGGPMKTWTHQEITRHASYQVLTAAERLQAVAKSGMLKKLNKRTIDLSVVNFLWFIPEIHNPLIYRQGNSSDPDNTLSAYDVIQPVGGSIDASRRGPLVYDVMGFNDNRLPSTSVLGDRDGLIPLEGQTKTFTTNGQPGGQPGFDITTIDHDSSTVGRETAAEMNNKWEQLRDYYREVVIEWISRENTRRAQ